jgi:hypothetical protein
VGILHGKASSDTKKKGVSYWQEGNFCFGWTKKDETKTKENRPQAGREKEAHSGQEGAGG